VQDAHTGRRELREADDGDLEDAENEEHHLVEEVDGEDPGAGALRRGDLEHDEEPRIDEVRRADDLHAEDPRTSLPWSPPFVTVSAWPISTRSESRPIPDGRRRGCRRNPATVPISSGPAAPDRRTSRPRPPRARRATPPAEKTSRGHRERRRR